MRDYEGVESGRRMLFWVIFKIVFISEFFNQNAIRSISRNHTQGTVRA